VIARYEVAVASTLTAASVPFATLKAGAAERMRVLEIGLFLTSAVASDIALARSATATTTPTIVLGQAQDPSDSVATGGIAVAWTTIGTANSISLRRVQLPATIGAGIIWTWSAMSPLVLSVPSATSEIMFVNRAGVVSGTFNLYVIFDE
jgi:hypothetical protein